MMWMALIGVILDYLVDSTILSTSTLAMLFAGTIPVPHVIVISLAIYKLLRKIWCFRRSCIQEKGNLSSVGRYSARSIEEQ